jgi:hypothetical protein
VESEELLAEKVMEAADRMDQEPLLLRYHDRPATDKV